MAASADSPGIVARPPLIYAAALVVVLLGRWFWPLPLLNSGTARWSSLGLVALGVGVASWGRRTMQAAGTNIDPTLPATAIVSSGPFRYSRNPLYVSLTLIYLSVAGAVNTWWGLVVVVPLLVTMHRGVVLREERYLEGKFGESYRQYRARVRRYL